MSHIRNADTPLTGALSDEVSLRDGVGDTFICRSVSIEEDYRHPQS